MYEIVPKERCSLDIKRYNYLLSETSTAYYELASAMGLSDSAMHILYTICNFGDSCLLSDITRMTGLRKQTINSALRKLEGDGVVYLSSADGKKKTVHLTQSGKELASHTALRLIDAENAIFDSWTEEERNVYLELTQRYLTQFKEKCKELTK